MDHLRDVFSRMGLNDKDIVALSGGHTLVCMLHPKTKTYELFPSFGSYHSYTFRVGATRSAQDSREHGHKTRSFSTTPISSKIRFSASACSYLNWTRAESEALES